MPATLADLIDSRTYYRDGRLGFQDANELFFNIIDVTKVVIQKKHNDDGSFNCREAAEITGNYDYNGATYDLIKQSAAGKLPTSITPSAAGQLTITFTSALAESTYDVQLTCGRDSDNRPGRICYNESAKTSAALGVIMQKAITAVDENLQHFSISIFQRS